MFVVKIDHYQAKTPFFSGYSTATASQHQPTDEKDGFVDRHDAGNKKHAKMSLFSHSVCLLLVAPIAHHLGFGPKMNAGGKNLEPHSLPPLTHNPQRWPGFSSHRNKTSATVAAGWLIKCTATPNDLVTGGNCMML